MKEGDASLHLSHIIRKRRETIVLINRDSTSLEGPTKHSRVAPTCGGSSSRNDSFNVSWDKEKFAVRFRVLAGEALPSTAPAGPLSCLMADRLPEIRVFQAKRERSDDSGPAPSEKFWSCGVWVCVIDARDRAYMRA